MTVCKTKQNEAPGAWTRKACREPAAALHSSSPTLAGLSLDPGCLCRPCRVLGQTVLPTLHPQGSHPLGSMDTSSHIPTSGWREKEGKRQKKRKERKKKKEESQSPPQTPLLSFVFSLSTASPNCTVAGQALCPKLPVQQKFPPGCSLRGCVLQSFAHLLGVFHRQRDPWYEAMGHHRLRAGTS